MNVNNQLKEGLITQNPVLVQLLGMCSVMAITTSLFNGIGMGLSVGDPDLLQHCHLLVRKVTPNNIRIAIFVVVIAGSSPSWTWRYKPSCCFVGVPGRVYSAIVVNCSLSAGLSIRIQERRRRVHTGRDFPGTRLHVVLIVMCVIREFLGSGPLAGILNGGNGIRLFPPTTARAHYPPRRRLPHAGLLIARCSTALRRGEEKKA
jgi:electron transport complex protein RnfE